MVRWVDKLLGTLTILNPKMGPLIGQSSDFKNVVNSFVIFYQKLSEFLVILKKIVTLFSLLIAVQQLGQIYVILPLA